MGKALLGDGKDVFGLPIPHLDDLPTYVYTAAYRIKRTWVNPITACSYSTSCPTTPQCWLHQTVQFCTCFYQCFWCPKWITLSCLMLSKWLLYSKCQHHALTLTPYPCVNDILADCAKGKIWSKLNMTNSFLPDKRVHSDDIHLSCGLHTVVILWQCF